MAMLPSLKSCPQVVDLDAVLDFAEEFILDARRLWTKGDLRQRQQVQKALFPDGVSYDSDAGFGTAKTAMFFKWIEATPAKKSGLASPTGTVYLPLRGIAV